LIEVFGSFGVGGDHRNKNWNVRNETISFPFLGMLLESGSLIASPADSCRRSCASFKSRRAAQKFTSTLPADWLPGTRWKEAASNVSGWVTLGPKTLSAAHLFVAFLRLVAQITGIISRRAAIGWCRVLPRTTTDERESACRYCRGGKPPRRERRLWAPSRCCGRACCRSCWSAHLEQVKNHSNLGENWNENSADDKRKTADEAAKWRRIDLRAHKRRERMNRSTEWNWRRRCDHSASPTPSIAAEMNSWPLRIDLAASDRQWKWKKPPEIFPLDKIWPIWLNFLAKVKLKSIKLRTARAERHAL